jgi:hypothetical protein
MSLFGFVKDIGRNIFNKDEDAAEKIKAHIESNNPGIKDLTVEYDDGIVDLCGECESSDAYEKAVLMRLCENGFCKVNKNTPVHPGYFFGKEIRRAVPSCV